jgi:hypothetical protein
VLRLRLGVFKVRSWAAGWSEVDRFSGGAVRLRRRGRRAMIGGVHLSARRREGSRQLEVGELSCDGGRNQVGRRRSTQACWAR